MKKLILLRHGKSAWDDPSLDDHDRPLAPRGQKAAPRMGRAMFERGLLPQVVLCSTAERTRQTLALIKPFLPPDVAIRFLASIYEAPAEALLEAVHGLDKGVRMALMIGHNPGLQDLALMLIKPPATPEVARLSEKFPTCGLACLTFPTQTWAGVSQKSGRLESFVVPKDLD